MLYETEVKEIAEKFSFDPLLIHAIIGVESENNPYALRFEPGWKYFYNVNIISHKLGIPEVTEKVQQAISWGLGQVMGSNLRFYGFTGKFMSEIADKPELGLLYTAMHLDELRKKYSDESSIISSYNAGSPRKDAAGQFVNQYYVNKVTRLLSKYRIAGGAV